VIVEMLTFEVDPAERDRWLHVEEVTWSRFLERQPGFVRKEMWVERGDDRHLHALVWWTDEATWKSVPPEELEDVDRAMGAWHRASTMRVWDCVRDC